jgi:hypothetical protein
MSFDGPSGYRQSEASTAPFPRPGLIHPVKAVEHVRLMLGWNARTLINDFEQNLVGSFTFWAVRCGESVTNNSGTAYHCFSGVARPFSEICEFFLLP